jgi:hypothetical protein
MLSCRPGSVVVQMFLLISRLAMCVMCQCMCCMFWVYVCMHGVISNTATAGRHIMYDDGEDANLDAAEEARVVRQALFGRLCGRWIKPCLRVFRISIRQKFKGARQAATVGHLVVFTSRTLQCPDRSNRMFPFVICHAPKPAPSPSDVGHLPGSAMWTLDTPWLALSLLTKSLPTRQE